MFLAGTKSAGEDATEPDRILDPIGVVGLHAPFLEVPEGDYTPKVVQNAYDAAVFSMAELVKRLPKLYLDAALLPEFLEKDRVSLLLLDNVDKVTRYRVELPIASPSIISPAMINVYCTNAHAWALHQIATAEHVDNEARKKSGLNRVNSPISIRDITQQTVPSTIAQKRQAGPRTRYVLPAGGGGEGSTDYCVFDLTQDRAGNVTSFECAGFVSSMEDERNAYASIWKGMKGKDQTFVPDLKCEKFRAAAFAPPDTPIKDLTAALALLQRLH